MDSEQPGLVALRDRIPFATRLGVELIEADASRVVGRLTWAPDLCTSDAESLHGGALMGLVDICGSLSAHLNLPEGAFGTTTIESSTHFLRATRGSMVEAKSEPLHVGRSTIVVQTDLTDDEGLGTVRVIQSQAVLYPREPPASHSGRL